MIHSKHVTLLVATIVALILVGVTYYLYLTTLMNSDDDVVSETPVEVNQEQTQTPQRTPEEIEALRQRLESVETPQRTPEEIEALRQRLEPVQ